MSEGELCNSRCFVTEQLNSLSGFWIGCGRHVGHEGKHATTLKCVQNAAHGLSNFRVGTIEWDDALANKRVGMV